MAVCRYHPDRPGIGVCMRCRAVICAACATRVDGVNHCHACLAALGRKMEPATRSRIAGIMTALLILGVTWLLFTGVF